MLRALTILSLFLLAGPSILFEQYRPPFVTTQSITARPIALPTTRIGPLEVLEAWQLASPHDGFGGVSAMALLDDRRFLLLTDTAFVLQFTLSEAGTVRDIAIRPFRTHTREKAGRDVESMWRNPATGQIWIGLENSNRVARLDATLTRIESQTRPVPMRHWRGNNGAESLVRMPDGRWLVLAEATSAGPIGMAALRFPGDPAVSGSGAPLRFGYQAWGMGALTDAALMPDGRVLLLHRRISPWRWFTSTLAIGDPATIRDQSPWTARPLAAFGWPVLSENFEALAVAPHPRGLSIWLASDDNFSPMQRTVLLHLLLPGARIPPR